jgi:hypothetical protein
MKKIFTALLVGMAAATPAFAIPFIGPGSPGALTLSVTGNLALNAGGGSVSASTASLVLVGGDQEPDGCAGGIYEVHGPCQVQAVYAVPGQYAFDWSYTTADVAGAGGDQFGVLVDGVPFTLSDLGGAVNQGGHQQYMANTSFGWFLNCTDCTMGAATATVTALAVPELSTGALALFGACVVAARVRRTRTGRAARLSVPAPDRALSKPASASAIGSARAPGSWHS